MPSPFPGMDPYLESPDIWPDFHDALAAEIRRSLNQSLPSPYYARLEMRPEIGIVEERGAASRIIPDIAVVHSVRTQAEKAGTAVLERPRADLSQSLDIETTCEPIRHHFVEVRDPSRGHQLVTLIEILSPSHKRPGPDRDAYQRKQQEVLGSDASLIEIDLRRRGDRVLPGPEVAAILSQLDPVPDYLVLVNRSWRRASFQAFPFSLREWLPCIPVPLREGQTEVPLDLQFAFNGAYDSGPYRRGAVDYMNPPSPPLPEADARWAEELLARVKAQNGGNAPK